MFKPDRAVFMNDFLGLEDFASSSITERVSLTACWSSSDSSLFACFRTSAINSANSSVLAPVELITTEEWSFATAKVFPDPVLITLPEPI